MVHGKPVPVKTGSPVIVVETPRPANGPAVRLAASASPDVGLPEIESVPSELPWPLPHLITDVPSAAPPAVSSDTPVSPGDTFAVPLSVAQLVPSAALAGIAVSASAPSAAAAASAIP